MVAAAMRPYHLLPWELTVEQTAALVEHSREHGTTVHAALSTAFLRAFGELRGTGWKREIQSPVDPRNRLAKPVGESSGLYVSLVEFLLIAHQKATSGTWPGRSRVFSNSTQLTRQCLVPFWKRRCSLTSLCLD